jgi:fructokinase
VKILGAIEAGGTKFICGIGTGPDDLQTLQIPTTTPEQTISAAIDFFRRYGRDEIAAVGIGSFGPVDLDARSPRYGYITSTPKAGWRNTDLAGAVRQALGVPIGFDTDVNAAALGESCWGAARGISSCLYLTIGTGIGGGAMLDGQLVHGMMHPEMGHIRLPHDLVADPFPGACPFHGDCLEGLASGPAIAARWGKPAIELPPDHPAWAIESKYLALAVANFVFTLSPECVILGGGVMRQEFLFDRIRAEVANLLNGYVRSPVITPPGLGGRSGVLGALALAEKTLAEKAAPK